MLFEDLQTAEPVEAVRYDSQGPRPDGFVVWDRAKGEGTRDASWGYVEWPQGVQQPVFHGDFIIRGMAREFVHVMHDLQFRTNYREAKRP